MNINGLNNSPNFSALYVNKEGMGETASSLADSLSRQLDYEKNIEKLDKMGVDVVIIKDPKNEEDRAKIVFADSNNNLYKINGKDHIKTGKTYDIGLRESYYDDNCEGVMDAIKGILRGTIKDKTTRPTNTQKELLSAFPIRDNVLAGKKPYDNLGIDFSDTDPDYNDPDWQRYAASIDFEA